MPTATIQDLQIERAAKHDEMKAILEKVEKENRKELSAAEEARFNALDAEYNRLTAQINDIQGDERSRTVAERDDFLNQPQSKPYRPGALAGKQGEKYGTIGLVQTDDPGQPVKGAPLLTNKQSLHGYIRSRGPSNTLVPLNDGTFGGQEPDFGKFMKGVVTGDWTNAALEKQMVNLVTGSQYLIPEIWSSAIIDMARNASYVNQAGAQWSPMENRTLHIARQIDDAQLHWKAENDPIPQSSPTFDSITMSAKTLAGYVMMSVEEFEDATNIGQLVRNSLGAALALELDRVALLGSGTGQEPTGLYNYTGVQRLPLGENGAAISNYNPFSQAVELIRGANGEPNAAIYSPRTEGTLDRLVDTNGQPIRPFRSFEQLSKYATNQVPNDLTVGTATNASAAFVGDWTKVIYGMRTAPMLEISRVSGDLFRNMQVAIRIYWRGDVNFTRPKHFAIIDGIIPAT